MKECYDIVLVDQPPRFTKRFLDIVDTYKDLRVIADVKNSNELLKILRKNEPDFVVMDFIMQPIDGLKVMDIAKEKGYKTKFLITSFIRNPDLIGKCFDHGASFYYFLPSRPNKLVERIRLLSALPVESDYQMSRESYIAEERIASMLKSLGIRTKLSGYRYLRRATRMVYENPMAIQSITENIYEPIARWENTTVANVDRSIRYAIEKAFETGDLQAINSMFGYTISEFKGKPCNSEFIAMIADRLSLSKTY